ncbi:MAG: hypothetical protein EHM47_02355 [Ignavibacteriales bacterium]|nr:MAG: hypothetical protein EHM47_02355 [Ignavibacteriales bacterium]
MTKNKFLFALILLFLSKIIMPQDGLKFERLSLQDGIAHNLTYCMIKDSKGYLWFGTMYGLARYEGTGYIMFKHDPEDPKSISFDDIVSLFEDRKGNIWIGTWGGGLNKYDPYKGEFTRFVYSRNNMNEINDNIVWAITEDKEGNIWLGTERGGLNKYNPSTGEFTHYLHDDSNPRSINSNSVQSLLYDSKGNLWAGCRGGLAKFDFESNMFDNFVHSDNDLNSISSGTVRTIYEDSRKNLWIGTFSGLNKFDGNYTFERYTSGQEPNPISHNSVSSLTEDDKGNLWIGTAYGLNYFEPTEKKFTAFYHNPEDPYSLSGNSIHNIVIDNSGLLWVNAYNTGINKLLREQQSNFINLSYFPENQNSLSNSNVISLTQGIDYNIWIGTVNGLNTYNPEAHTITRVAPDENPGKNFISALETDYDGNLWIGTRAGLRLFNPFSQRYIEPEFQGLDEAGLYSAFITSILVDSLNVWIGTYNNGLFRLDRKSNTLTKFSFEGKNFRNYHADFILTIYEDKSGRIWVGSYGGLMMYNKNDKTFSSYMNDPDDETTLSNNYVFSIFEDSRNELWIGTANGLNKFIFENAAFEHFFEKDGLPNSVISSIVEDFNKHLWISTNKGISKFNYEERTFTNYDISNGISGNLFNKGAGLYGIYTNIMFGGSRGCLLIYPGEMKFSDYNPPVYVSSIKKITGEGESSLITSFNEELEISSSEKTININFASLDFSNPAKNKFHYMLEGVDNDWINADSRNSATYNNLEPGEYILKVRGTNSDGIFSSNISELKLIVIPSFWQTWWFKLLAALILFTAVFYLVRYKVISKIKREIELQNIREEEAAKIRKQTAADFHDELGHRLTRISLLSEIIRKKLHNTFLEIDPLLKNIAENSQILFDGTRDFIWAIDPAQDNLYDLIVRLKDFADELFNSTEIKFNIKGLDESLQKYPLNIEWKRQVTLIFKEGLNNALKHSGCKNVTLEVMVRNNNMVEIFLFDDGKGFIQDKVYDGNGLKNMKRRGEKINSIIDIDSRPQIGTKIFFKGIIPLNSIDYTRKVA